MHVGVAEKDLLRLTDLHPLPGLLLPFGTPGELLFRRFDPGDLSRPVGVPPEVAVGIGNSSGGEDHPLAERRVPVSRSDSGEPLGQFCLYHLKYSYDIILNLEYPFDNSSYFINKESPFQIIRYRLHSDYYKLICDNFILSCRSYDGRGKVLSCCILTQQRKPSVCKITAFCSCFRVYADAMSTIFQ